jgi:hypothetical protein
MLGKKTVGKFEDFETYVVNGMSSIGGFGRFFETARIAW